GWRLPRPIDPKHARIFFIRPHNDAGKPVSNGQVPFAQNRLAARAARLLALEGRASPIGQIRYCRGLNACRGPFLEGRPQAGEQPLGVGEGTPLLPHAAGEYRAETKPTATTGQLDAAASTAGCRRPTPTGRRLRTVALPSCRAPRWV